MRELQMLLQSSPWCHAAPSVPSFIQPGTTTIAAEQETSLDNQPASKQDQ
jgi:hypothetical protein